MKKIFTLIFAALAVLTLNAQVLHEWHFEDVVGTGGNDGNWSSTVATNTLGAYGDWTLANAYKGSQCLKLGASSKQGSAQTPALTSLSGKAKLTFRAAAWNNAKEKTKLNLEITGGGELSDESVTLQVGAFSDYEVTITNGTADTKITFKGAEASGSRFFLADVAIATVEDPNGLVADKENAIFDVNSKNGSLAVTVTDSGVKTIEVYTVLGQKIASEPIVQTTTDIAVQAGQIVFVKAGKYVQKVITK